MGEWLWSWWEAYKANREHIVPLLTFVAAVSVTWAALKQARNSTRQAQTAAAQAEIARERHEAQINTDQERADADRQRRINESFTKAIELLGNKETQVRLGGIYILERIARESEPDYWPIMEALTAFVRVKARWKDENTALPQAAISHDQPKTPLRPPPEDIEAVLTVIRRRDAKSREREQVNKWSLDFTLADLRMAFFHKAHLERADLRETHLEGAFLSRAHLNGANLLNAHLEGANLAGAHLEEKRS
jgi:uncharacterized protein YjbI with pentapeptide repeats